MSTFNEQRPEKLFIGEMTHYPFPAHVHDLAELIVVTRGEAVLSIDGVRYRMEPGDAAMIFPLTVHSYDELSEDSDGLVAIFPPDIIPEYAGTFHGLQPEYPLLRATDSGEDLRVAVACLSRISMGEDLPLCVAYLHVLLAAVLHRLTYRPSYDFSERNLGARIVQYVSLHACEDLTQERAARALGVSVSHLSHFFSEKMSTNFRGFINAIRIERARLLMRDPNLTLTEICSLCGYSSIRTFRRAFQQEMGILPSEHMQVLRGRVIAPSPLTSA